MLTFIHAFFMSILIFFIIFIFGLEIFLSTKKGKEFNENLEKKKGYKIERIDGVTNEDDGLRDYVMGIPSSGAFRYGDPFKK